MKNGSQGEHKVMIDKTEFERKKEAAIECLIANGIWKKQSTICKMLWKLGIPAKPHPFESVTNNFLIFFSIVFLDLGLVSVVLSLMNIVPLGFAVITVPVCALFIGLLMALAIRLSVSKYALPSWESL